MKVAVEALTKRYTLKGSPAVFEASFEAPAGGITSLLGPSGSGKTTVLRCIAGLEPVQQGRVLFGGDDVTHVPVRERGLGFVFQMFALFPNLTVRENVAFGLEIRREPAAKVRERVDEMLALTQLEPYAKRYPSELSGGQRQRVGFARALAPRPRILLLDEPFAALDVRVRGELRAFLRKLHEAVPVTTLLVTHDQEEALELSDQIVVMESGRVHQVGTPRDVYDTPATAFVASFVGSSNVLSGVVADGGRATLGAVQVPAPADAQVGAAIRAIVRPHDVRISKTERDGAVAVGHVERLSTLGAEMKLELTLPGGELVTVIMPRTEVDEMAVAVGDRVYVDLAAAKIFADDYAI
jgi:sulfate transport system ATP-binding protein